MKGKCIVAILLGSVLVSSAIAKPPVSILKYGDDEADGKKSLGGSGELIRFSLPMEKQNVSGIRIHASRYGYPRAPDEDFLVYILNADLSEVLHTKMVPYKLLERGDEKWVKVKFKKALKVTKIFWIALDFRAHRTKGVYVSYDTSTGGKYSKTGLPGLKSEDVDFGGDWMIQVDLSR